MFIYDDKVDVITFRVDEETGNLKPQSESARLFLSMLFLWEHDYDQAREILDGYGSQTSPLKEEEIELIESIFLLEERNHDSDPKAIAVRMYAAYLLIRNHLHFDHQRKVKQEAMESWQEHLEKLYGKPFSFLFDAYIQKIDQIPERLRLSKEEESLIQQKNVGTIRKNTLQRTYLDRDRYIFRPNF